MNVRLAGNYAYVANYSDGLMVLDISDPVNPVFREQFDTAGIAFEVYILGNYAYVADFAGGLEMIYVSNL